MELPELEHERLRRLMEVGQSLVSQLDPETVLHQVLDVARELTGARYAALGILDDDRRGLERFLTSGIDEAAREEIGSLPRGRGVLGVLISNPHPLRLADVSSHPRSYGFPPGHPSMTTFLGIPLLIKGEAWGNLYLTEKAEGEFSEEDEASVIVLGNWASIAIENARLHQAVEGRRMQLERAVRGLEATTEISRALGGETDLDRVLVLIAKRARALVESRAILILLNAGDEFEVAVAAGELRHSTVGEVIPIEGSLAGEALHTGRPLRLDDTSTANPRLAELADADTALIVPLMFRGTGLGVIVALDRLIEGPRFGPDDEDLLSAFAASAATAVRTARSVADDRLRDAIHAAEQERGRWARELHDETLQGLGGLQALLSSALGADGERLEHAVREAVEHTRTEISNLRSLITELRPAALDELGLVPALQSLAERTRAIQGLEVDLDVDLGEGGRLPPEVESTVYRVVQEALTNVGKHAAASAVRVSMRRERDAVAVEVADDGRGYDTSESSAGFGVPGMRERVELLGGTHSIDSAPAKGTTVSARIPLG